MVKIIGYEGDKFITEEGHKVSRLSLLFKFIDRQSQIDRLNQAKTLMENANEELRYLSYVENLPNV